MSSYHIPVLPKETIDLLQIKKGGKYIDCTLGGGGHTELILQAGGEVLAIDQDLEAFENCKIENCKLTLRQGNFAHLNEIAKSIGWNKVDGILMDLGVSSHQLETDYRGFSFNKNAQLDMRMDQKSQIPDAGDLINGLTEKELAELFFKYGEENFSKPIAREIVKARKIKLIESTDELAKIVLKVRHSKDRTHPATRVFQALRIAVNDELNSLKEALPKAVELLITGGKLVVISFHSLEDRIVKNFMGKSELVTPTQEEIENNPRARSGKLRVYTKL